MAHIFFNCCKVAADVLTSDNMKNRHEHISVAIYELKVQFLFELDTALKYQKKLKKEAWHNKKSWLAQVSLKLHQKGCKIKSIELT